MAQVPSYVPSSGLVGWWPFNGNANDESGNGNNGVGYNVTADSNRFGQPNKALLFNGINSGVELPGNSFPLTNGSYSLNAWFKLTTIIDHLNGFTVFDDRDSTVWNYKGRYLIDLSTNPIESYYQMSDVGPRIYYNNVPSYTWINITCVYNSVSEKMFFFKNGVIIDSTDCNNNWFLSGNRKIQIGRAQSPITYNGNDYFTGHWQGQIDDIGIWNRALTQQEITDLYNANICYEYVTVTDTLVINTGITGYNPITYLNTLKIWPNPSNDHITIDAGDLTTMNGYSIKIEDAQGQQVFQNAVNQQQFYIDITSWGGNGFYFVRIIDPQGNTVDIKKIVLQ